MAVQAVVLKAIKRNTHAVWWSRMHKKNLDDLKADLAVNLRTIRLSKGIAQERLAFDAGVDRTVVSKIERAVTNPSLDVLLRLANQLEIEVSQLLEGRHAN